MIISKFIKLKLLAAALLMLLLMYSGCAVFTPAEAKAAPWEVIEAMIISLGKGKLPAGQLYLSNEIGNDTGGSVSSSDEAAKIIAVIFGGGDYPEAFAGAEAYAVWLPSMREPCEFAVILAKSKLYTDEIAALCAERADLLERYYAEAEPPGEIETRICVIGRYVILSVSGDNQAALDAAERAIK